MDWSLQLVHWMGRLVMYWVLLIAGIELFDIALVHIIAPWVKKL